MLNTLPSVWNDDAGVTGSEYAMLVGLVSLVAIFALTEINAELQDLLSVRMGDRCIVVGAADLDDAAKLVTIDGVKGTANSVGTVDVNGAAESAGAADIDDTAEPVGTAAIR